MSLPETGAVRPLTSDEHELVRVATLAALRHMPYLAGVLYNLRPVAAPGLGRMGVDHRWRLYVDPEAIAGWPVEHRAATLLHEAGHLLRRHADRATAAGITDRDRWNLATDLDINADLTAKRMTVEVPRGWPLPSTYGLPNGLTAEEYYDRLEGQAGGRSGSDPGEGQGDGEGEGEGGGGGGGQSDAPDGEPVPGEGQGCGSGSGGQPLPCELGDLLDDGGDGGGVSDAEADLIAREAAMRIEEHAEANGRGSLPAGLARWAAEELAPPKVDWRRELSAAVRRATTHAAGMVDYTYRRPSRRRIPGVILPSMHRPRPQLVTIVDTSASMPPAALSAALSEIEGISRSAGLRGPDHRVMTVDAAASKPQPVTRAADVVLTGGGGTNMAVGIEAALALRPRPDVIVVMTDGLTPWPTTRPTATKVVIVLITSGATPPPPPDWAHVVTI